MDIADRLIDSITQRFYRLSCNPFIGRSRDEEMWLDIFWIVLGGIFPIAVMAFVLNPRKPGPSEFFVARSRVARILPG